MVTITSRITRIGRILSSYPRWRTRDSSTLVPLESLSLLAARYFLLFSLLILPPLSPLTFLPYGAFSHTRGRYTILRRRNPTFAIHFWFFTLVQSLIVVPIEAGKGNFSRIEFDPVNNALGFVTARITASPWEITLAEKITSRSRAAHGTGYQWPSIRYRFPPLLLLALCLNL